MVGLGDGGSVGGGLGVAGLGGGGRGDGGAVLGEGGLGHEGSVGGGLGGGGPGDGGSVKGGLGGGGLVRGGSERVVGILVTRSGAVEGTVAHDIVLDTGCTQTMVHKALVPRPQMIPGETVPVRCSHGDVTYYPLANVRLYIQGTVFTIRAALSPTLPVSDTPHLGQLLSVQAVGGRLAEAMIVTRAQAKAHQEAEAARIRREAESGANSTPVFGQTPKGSNSNEPPLGSTFSDDLFLSTAPRPRLSRQQKRINCHSHGLTRAKDSKRCTAKDSTWDGPMSQYDFRTLPRDDESLTTLYKHAAEGDPTFFLEDDLLYRRCTRKQHDHDGPTNQCRKEVQKLAHAVPRGGHLGRKTFNRIAVRFYWLTMYQDVADFCHTCDTCQRFRHHRTPACPYCPYLSWRNHSPESPWILWALFPGVGQGTGTSSLSVIMAHRTLKRCLSAQSTLPLLQKSSCSSFPWGASQEKS